MKPFLRLALVASITVFYGYVAIHLIIANLEQHVYHGAHSHKAIFLHNLFLFSLIGMWVFSFLLRKGDSKLYKTGITLATFALLLVILMPAVC